MTSKHQPALGIPLTLLACLANASMATTVKWVASEVSNTTIVFMRFAVSLFLLSLLLLFLQRKKSLKKLLTIQNKSSYLVRISAAISCLYAYFFAIKTIPLTTAVVLVFTAPLFIPIVTWFWKKIPIPPVVWWALGTGFCGVLLIIGPQLTSNYFGFGLGVLSGILSAIAYAASRVQTKTESPLAINFYLFIIATPLTFLIGCKNFFKELPLISSSNWLLLGLVGVFGFLYQVILIRAIQSIRVRLVGAFMYFSILFVFFSQWLFFDKTPSMFNFMGVLLIVLGGLLMVLLDSPKKDLSK